MIHDGEHGREYLKGHNYAAIKIFECTSFDVGRHIDMLAEPRHLKGAAQLVGLGGRDVEVPDN